jgi:hypothetical protein
MMGGGKMLVCSVLQNKKNICSLTAFHFPIYKIHFFQEPLLMDSVFFRSKLHNKIGMAALKRQNIIL